MAGLHVAITFVSGYELMSGHQMHLLVFESGQKRQMHLLVCESGACGQTGLAIPAVMFNVLRIHASDAQLHGSMLKVSSQTSLWVCLLPCVNSRMLGHTYTLCACRPQPCQV